MPTLKSNVMAYSLEPTPANVHVNLCDRPHALINSNFQAANAAGLSFLRFFGMGLAVHTWLHLLTSGYWPPTPKNDDNP